MVHPSTEPLLPDEGVEVDRKSQAREQLGDQRVDSVGVRGKHCRNCNGRAQFLRSGLSVRSSERAAGRVGLKLRTCAFLLGFRGIGRRWTFVALVQNLQSPRAGTACCRICDPVARRAGGRRGGWWTPANALAHGQERDRSCGNLSACGETRGASPEGDRRGHAFFDGSRIASAAYARVAQNRQREIPCNRAQRA